MTEQGRQEYGPGHGDSQYHIIMAEKYYLQHFECTLASKVQSPSLHLYSTVAL